MAQAVEPASPRKVAIATIAALLVAALLLVTVVLPAEYGIDMLGAGAALGLLGLAQERPVAAQDDEYRLDEALLRVGRGRLAGVHLPHGGGRHDAVLVAGHRSPRLQLPQRARRRAPPGYAESFDAQENDRAHGAYTAPFTGVHGWYWENHTASDGNRLVLGRPASTARRTRRATGRTAITP